MGSIVPAARARALVVRAGAARRPPNGGADVARAVRALRRWPWGPHDGHDEGDTMATLQEQFDQAMKAVEARRDDPVDVPRRQVRARLESLRRDAESADGEARDEAMRRYIALAGDLGQEDA